jgi:molybdopterin molybdotransferase
MLSLEEARGRLLDAVELLAVETVALRGAAGRVLAQEVISTIDLPVFDNSAMDGFAVRSGDVLSASSEAPVALRLAGRSAAGEVFPGQVPTGSCVRVFTGSVLPEGADAVVMQEDTRLDAGPPETVLVLDRVKPWENVRLRGEDAKAGAALALAGERLTASRMGLLAAAGVRSVRVHRRPVIGLLATGSELVESGAALAPGKIYESNRLTLEPLLSRSGAIARVFPLVPDALEHTRRALAEAFAECDGVVTSGGVSVGELDFVKAAFEQLGGSMDFWRVAIKPGKPFAFGRWGEKFLFGLPGNPVSAVVTFLLLVRPALWRWQGATSVLPATSHCVLAEPLVNRGDRSHFMRVRIDEQGVAHSAGTQASHLFSSLAQANGLVEVPPATTLAAGAMVAVMRMDD